MTTRLKTQLGRRQFLSLGAAFAATAALDRTSIGTADPRRRKNPWIPSDEFLEDLPRIMDAASLPGLAIATAEDGQVAWTHAAGVANQETRALMRTDSVFEAASMGKPVFAYVVMRLVDENRIDLDRPLARYRRPDYLSSHPYIDLITARDVLRHTTGLPNWRKIPEEKLTPSFKPGSRYLYSGEGYFWLQLVVERITGEGVDAVMRSRLFGPAKMLRCVESWSAEAARMTACGYKRTDDGKSQPEFQYKREMGNRFLAIAKKRGEPISSWTYEDVIRALPEARELPGDQPFPKDMEKASIEYFKLPVNVFPNVAGMLSATVSDYARFMILMMDRPKRASWEITEKSRRAMLSPQITLKSGALDWGLGWGLERSPSGLLFYHGGDNGGYKSFGFGDPVRRRAIVIFTNGSGGDAVYPRIIENATGHVISEFML